ncbi:MAG: DUF1232 domain-containing protein [Cytophagaceae bacterium]|nr:DUF1232 domain-containing protein [Cytophagaceae bacterium]
MTNRAKINEFLEGILGPEKKFKWKNFDDGLSAFVRMIKLYFKGVYKDLSPWLFINSGIAILYGISNIDLIPDHIAGIGLVDDLAVAGVAIHTCIEEVEKFKNWEAFQHIHEIQVV